MKSLNIVKEYIHKIFPNLSSIECYDLLFEELIKEYKDDIVFKELFKIDSTEDDGLTLYVIALNTYIKYEYCLKSGHFNGVYITHPVINNKEFLYDYPLVKSSPKEIFFYISSLLNKDDIYIEKKGITFKSSLDKKTRKDILDEISKDNYSEGVINLLSLIFYNLDLKGEIDINDEIISLWSYDELSSVLSKRIEYYYFNTDNKPMINFYFNDINTSILVEVINNSWDDYYVYRRKLFYSKPYTSLNNSFTLDSHLV